MLPENSMDSSQTANAETFFGCSACGKKFDTVAELDLHKSREHADKKDIHKAEGGHSSNKYGVLPAVLFVVLILISTVQTVYAAQVFAKLKKGVFGGGATGGVPLPSNLQNLPEMVGGC